MPEAIADHSLVLSVFARNASEDSGSNRDPITTSPCCLYRIPLNKNSISNRHRKRNFGLPMNSLRELLLLLIPPPRQRRKN